MNDKIIDEIELLKKKISVEKNILERIENSKELNDRIDNKYLIKEYIEKTEKRIIELLNQLE